MTRILIVEDDIQQCLGLAEMLGEFGFETAVAGDGLKALEILGICCTPEQPLPDFILLDLHMPNMDGWQLRDTLREDERYSKIPIIIISGDDAACEVEASAHFCKPLDVRALITAILQ